MSHSESRHPRREACAQIATGIALFFLLDNVVFGNNIYFPWIAPNSSLGSMARIMENIQRIPPGQRSVLVIGDSRIGEGFSATLATEEVRKLVSSSTFTTGGVAGTLPRVWYYLLRQIQKPSARLSVVAIMTTSYHDNDLDSQAERLGDIAFVHPLLSMSDLVDFPKSFVLPTSQLQALEAILFKGLSYKNDFQDFVHDPLARVHDVVAYHEHGLDWIANYPGRDASLTGLQFNITSGKLSLPPNQSPAQSSTLTNYAEQLRQWHGHLPDNAAAAAYRHQWLSRIADLCQQAGVKLIVFRIPRGPLHHLVDADDQPDGVLADLARAGKLELLPADTFDKLEWPQFFFDELHLNRAGREAFSIEFARTLLPYIPVAK